MNRQEANRKAANLSAGMTSDQIVAAFKITDQLMEEGGLSTPDFMDLANARGWMLDELARRDELFLVGLES